MKRCLTSLMIKELLGKAKRCHFVPTNCQNWNGSTISSFLWEMGTVVLEGMQIVLPPSESNLEILVNVKKCVSMTTSFTSRYLPYKNSLLCGTGYVRGCLLFHSLQDWKLGNNLSAYGQDNGEAVYIPEQWPRWAGGYIKRMILKNPSWMKRIKSY